MARKGKKHRKVQLQASMKRQTSELKKDLLLLREKLMSGKYDEALKLAESTVSKHPGAPEAWEVLADVYAYNNQLRHAASAFEKSISKLGYQDIEKQIKLAHYQIIAGLGMDAVRCLEVIVKNDPTNKNAWTQLSRALHYAGKNRGALDASNQAYALAPNCPEVLTYRANILNMMRYHTEAKEIAHKLKSIDSSQVGVSNLLANLYLREGDYIEAEKHFVDELELNDNSAAAYNRIIAMHYNPLVDPEFIKEEAVSWYDKYFNATSKNRATTKKIKNKRLKIGLLSSGFRTHPVGQMLLPALESRETEFLQIVAYSTFQGGDELTLRIKSAVDQWKMVYGLSEAELDRQIRKDNIDILIDMNGGGDGSCFNTIAKEPAPIIVKWVGMLINTTGLRCIDYLLSDSLETPQGVDKNYIEKLVRLPNDYICYHIPDYAPEVNDLPAEKNGYITFGCLNNPAKLSDPLIREWSKVLKDTLGSKLLLKNTQFEGEEFCEKIRDRFASFGIEEDRLILDGPEKHSEFLKAYHRIDIALDTWPYSGGLTTCEALMMGVPVVTCTGPTFAGRHSATHLANAGLHELVTDNWEDFHRRVKELASDIESLATIRSALRTIVKDSPLCNGKLFASHFTTAMRAIWQRHCEGKAPEALTMNKEGHAQFEDEDTPVVLGSVENTSDQEVDWSLDEPVIIVDNAALLPRHPRFSDLLKSGNIAIMSFDPGSQYTKQTEELKALGEWHHHPHALLGDGFQKTLYVTLNPKKTGTLKPLSPHQLPERRRQDLQLLTELPIDSLRLDDIQGLPSVDILLLDDVNNALAVLENGDKQLKTTLLINVKIAFQATHEQQPSLEQLQTWASHNGFCFYTLLNLEYYSYTKGEMHVDQNEPGELVSAEAVFLPSRDRLRKLDQKKKKKLAFYLNNVCLVEDMTSFLLEKESDNSRENLSFEKDKAKKVQQQHHDVPSPAGPLISQNQHVTGNPVVSILCVTYNHVHFIEDAIKGFLAQKTNFPFEVVIHDDASIDGTQAIIKKYAEQYPDMIKPFLQAKNQYSRNRKPLDNILPFAKGKYIATCEGDDFWTDNEKLQKQFNFLEQNSDYVVTHHNAIISDGEKILKNSKLPEHCIRDYSSEELIMNNCFILTVSIMFRKVINKFPKEKGHVANGDNFLISMLGLYGKSKFMDNIKPAVYRLHENATWSSKSAAEKNYMLANTFHWISKYHDRKGRKSTAMHYLKMVEKLNKVST